VTCKLDKKAGIGSLQCKVCGQRFQSNINYLSHAVDVYSEWVDACDEVANPKPRSSGGGRSKGVERRESHQDDLADDDDDDFPVQERSRPAPMDDYDDDDDL